MERKTSGGKRHLTIREMPADSRPRERMEMLGAGALSDAELLAILLRTGSGGESALDLAHRLLFEQGGLVRLSRLPFSELCRVRGLGRAKACQLQAGFELALRLLPSRSADRLQVLEPADLAPQLILELGRLDHEVLRVVLLDAKLRVVRDVDLYRGTVHGSAVRTGELFKDGVRHNASAIVLAHNHPSGDPTPSLEDVHATREAVEAGKLLDIEVLDHLVVGERSYLSMRTLGLGFAG